MICARSRNLESDTHAEDNLSEGDSSWNEPSPIDATATPTSPQQYIEIPAPWSLTAMTRETATLLNELQCAEPQRVPHFRPPPGTPEEQTDALLNRWDSETRRSSLNLHQRLRIAYCLGKLQHDHPQAFRRSLCNHYQMPRNGRHNAIKSGEQGLCTAIICS
jgi:hypothetical protein